MGGVNELGGQPLESRKHCYQMTCGCQFYSDQLFPDDKLMCCDDHGPVHVERVR